MNQESLNLLKYLDPHKISFTNSPSFLFNYTMKTIYDQYNVLYNFCNIRAVCVQTYYIDQFFNREINDKHITFLIKNGSIIHQKLYIRARIHTIY